MKVRIRPATSLKGTVKLPASKSYSIRAFLIAACGGMSVIKNPSHCDDAVVAKSIAQSLGSKISKKGSDFRIEADAHPIVVKTFDVNESGTTLRFLLPLLGINGRPAKVLGKGTLKGRPNLFLTRTLRSMGVQIRGTGRQESVPLWIKGGRMNAGMYSIDGSLSSQFISALLIACPLLEDKTILSIKGKKIVSTDYITMTLQVLKMAGIRISKNQFKEFRISGSQAYQGLKNFCVPSDYGLAAFLLAAGALVPSNIVLKGYLRKDLIQADGHIIPLLRKMNVKFKLTESSISLKGPFRLRGGIFSLKDCPDLVPIMAVLALFADRTTRLIDIQHARAKESDRISDLRQELLKVGAHVTETKNTLTIHPQSSYQSDVLLNSHKDHRLAMAFSVLGLKTGVIVKDMECHHKSYPKFLNDFRSLGVSAIKC